MFTNNLPEEELKKLTKAITQAITGSESVKEVLGELHKKNLVNSSMMMFLALNIQNIDSIFAVRQPGAERPLIPCNHQKSLAQQIDGRKLSKNEIEYQEYLRKDFDEEDWLKKVGIDPLASKT